MLKTQDLPLGLICIDPGYDTGIALVEVKGRSSLPTMIMAQTVNYQNGGSGARDFYQVMSGFYERAFKQHRMARVDVVLEKFTKRPGVVDPELTALKIMGVLDHWWAAEANRFGSKFHEQVPVQGKFMVTNRVLVRVGVWVPGKANRHINDATRHGISWLVDQAHVGTCKAAFPKEG